MNSRAIWPLLAISLTLSPFAVTQVQLFRPGVGIIVSYGLMLSTDDNGNNWKEISPTFPNKQARLLYFLDRFHGWALMCSGDYGETHYDLASTNDAGATWSLTHIKLNVNPNAIILLPQGSMQFSDLDHGWINLDVESGSAFHRGYLLRTVDGGKNWTFAGAPSAGEIRFIDPKNGWLLFAGELWVTHDAAAHWEEMSLKSPAGVNPEDRKLYHLPVFADQTHGVLEVDFESPATQSTDECWQSLFLTSDAGRNWKFKQILARAAECKQMALTSAGDSTVIVAGNSEKILTLMKFDLRGDMKPATASSDLGFLFSVRSASFVNSQQGWVDTGANCEAPCPSCGLRPAHGSSWNNQSCPALLSTKDGGKTWSDITLRQTCVTDATTGTKTCTREYWPSPPLDAKP